MNEIKAELLQQLDHQNIVGGALCVSSIRDSAFDGKPYERCIERLVRLIQQPGGRGQGSGLSAYITRINNALFGRFGMAAAAGRPRLVIDDPDRFFLDRVIDNRSGSPLALSILYSHLAASIGLKSECLAVGSYYFLNIMHRGAASYIDPFEGGRVLASEELKKRFKAVFLRNPMASTTIFERVTPIQLLVRLIQQIKQIYMLKGNALYALRAVDLLAALFPNSPEFARDRGILYCEMEYFSKAVDDLKYYMRRRPKAEDLVEIKQLRKMLKGYREVVN